MSLIKKLAANMKNIIKDLDAKSKAQDEDAREELQGFIRDENFTPDKMKDHFTSDIFKSPGI
jgi:pyruvate/2-oxoglutarate dehydrogenase complex dihydrolipoamide acyltransferase (E2) component